jgi:hypothetical protein
MCEIKKYGKINEANLLRGEYLQSLMEEALENDLLDAVEFKNIQVALLILLSEQVNKFNSNDSSSIRVENAQALLQSISFTISLTLKEAGNADEALNLLLTEKIEDLFKKGITLIKTYFEKAKIVLDEIQKNRFNINNLAYRDTVFKGIPQFFLYYDWKFAACDAPGSIDYPLVYDRMDLNGIEYISEYLYHLCLENKFCGRYSSFEIECLMRGHTKYYKEDLINVYELVLQNLIGRSLLNYDLDSLDITEEDRDLLKQLLQPLTGEQLRIKINSEFDKIISDFDMFDSNDVGYLKAALKNIIDYIKRNLQLDKLNKIFISLKDEKAGETYSDFIDGRQMEDEKLRSLIDEMKDCRYLPDKIAMIRTSVRSLSDLKELMKECFYEDEYSEIFKLLTSEEMNILKNIIDDEGKQYI